LIDPIGNPGKDPDLNLDFSQVLILAHQFGRSKNPGKDPDLNLGFPRILILEDLKAIVDAQLPKD